MKQKFQNPVQKSVKSDISLKKSEKRPSAIEQAINSIYNQISDNASETMCVCKEKPAKGSACVGIVSVYSKADLARQNQEMTEFGLHPRGIASGDGQQKPYRARPLVKYAFYPSVYNPDCIGSVAIYGSNGLVQYPLLKKRMQLFGRRISSVEIEQGARLFLSVKFATLRPAS